MCKILTFTNAKKIDIQKTAEVIGNILLGIERDGFGYAVQGQNNVFGEKTIAPNFCSRLEAKNIVRLPIVEARSETFGYLDKPMGPAIFHGRTSTNDKGLLNCHPMQIKKWNLIHNGVVDDHGPKYSKKTTNDSEDLLHRLLEGIESVENNIAGYFAFCAIDHNGRLHVGRDSIATLHIAWIEKVQSYLIGTTEDLIKKTAEALNLKTGPIDLIKPNTYAIFNGNDIEFHRSISPRGFDKKQAELAELSLGRSLSVEDSNSLFTDDGECLSDLMREAESINDEYIIEFAGQLISASEYSELDEYSKRLCTVERPDGTLLFSPKWIER
jgi:hypothetical protein